MKLKQSRFLRWAIWQTKIVSFRTCAIINLLIKINKGHRLVLEFAFFLIPRICEIACHEKLKYLNKLFVRVKSVHAYCSPIPIPIPTLRKSHSHVDLSPSLNLSLGLGLSLSLNQSLSLRQAWYYVNYTSAQYYCFNKQTKLAIKGFPVH